MLEVWRRVVVGSAIVVYVAGLGCAGGMLLQRLRADRPADAARGARLEVGAPMFLVGLAVTRTAAAEVGR